MSECINILVADDSVLFREGLCMLLQSEQLVKVVGEANNGLEAMELISRHKPDVVVTDIQMPEMDGIEFTKELRHIYPQVRVIGLTMFNEDALIVKMLEAGAKGYLQKNANKQKVIEAIRAVFYGGWYFCDSTTAKLSRLIASSQIEGFATEPPQFTENERKIIQLVCEQYSTKEIAMSIHLGERTVESYRHKIFEKMGVKNMAGMVIYAIRAGLYNLKDG